MTKPLTVKEVKEVEMSCGSPLDSQHKHAISPETTMALTRAYLQAVELLRRAQGQWAWYYEDKYGCKIDEDENSASEGSEYIEARDFLAAVREGE